MIVEYNRPTTIDEALTLLNRKNPISRPMGGGSGLNQPSQERLAVVDLQALGLDHIVRSGKLLSIGATVTLQSLLESPDIPEGFGDSIKSTAGLNLRQAATIGGIAAAGNGRSLLLTALLVMDAELEIMHAEEGIRLVDLGDWLPLRGNRRGDLITTIKLPLNVRIKSEVVARTPADLPIIGAIVAQWPSGRTRLALCGWGSVPVLSLDGPEASGLEAAARNAASGTKDAWASAIYRQEIATILAKRALAALAG
jgi:putative selenate reductase FAD-binding subunit